MMKPFDTIVGPNGVWKDDTAEAVDEQGLTVREAFALRCLNAAVNLYGILTRDEFVSLYNGYAKDHEPAVSRLMTVEELDGLIGRLIKVCAPQDEVPDSFEDILDRPECWFDFWDYKQTGQRLIVYDQLTALGPDGTPMTPDERIRKARRKADELISDTLAMFVKVDFKVLPEDEFLEYEEPTYSEETAETRKFEKFLVREYALDEDDAGLDLWGIQGELRCNGATITQALDYIQEQCEWRPESKAAFARLVREISPVIFATRIWAYRGHTKSEMCQLGLIDCRVDEEIPDVFGLADDYLEALDDDYIRLVDLPDPVYTGPIDFKLVKDVAWREAKMRVYEDVRQVMNEFCEKQLAKEFKPERLHDAAVRLGYLKRGDSVDSLPQEKFLIVADFISVFDDAKGGSSTRRLAKRKKKLTCFDRLALNYFSNARYSWLLIEATKAGFGMKCRDLLTGEELFIVDKSGSVGDIKGRTICVGIVPMGDVYISSGPGSCVYMKDPEAELGDVLSQIGVSDARPIRLSFHDQARFVEATANHLQNRKS